MKNEVQKHEYQRQKKIATSPHLGRDYDNPNRIAGIRKVGNGLIPVKLGHATSVGVALDALGLKVVLYEVDKGDKLGEDDDLVRVIGGKPLVDQFAGT